MNRSYISQSYHVSLHTACRTRMSGSLAEVPHQRVSTCMTHWCWSRSDHTQSKNGNMTEGKPVIQLPVGCVCLGHMRGGDVYGSPTNCLFPDVDHRHPPTPLTNLSPHPTQPSQTATRVHSLETAREVWRVKTDREKYTDFNLLVVNIFWLLSVFYKMIKWNMN